MPVTADTSLGLSFAPETIVIVIPELDMVVGFNGSSYGEFAKWYRWGLQLVPKYIIPAMLGRDVR